MNLYGGLILGVNTLYRLFCFFKLFLMDGKGLMRERELDIDRALLLQYRDPLASYPGAQTHICDVREIEKSS